MQNLLTVFIDGLNPESLKYMSFVSRFEAKSKIQTEFGYSVTCHSSMYSGVYPNKHLNWFLWQYNSNLSMYKWTGCFSKHPLSNYMVTAYAAYILTKWFNHTNTSYYGVKYNSSSPFRYWHHFDIIEKKLWNEAGFLVNYPTIFDILRKNNIDFKVSGMHTFGGPASLEIIDHDDFDTDPRWTYLFIGEIDGLTHKYGQESEIVINKLKEVDKATEKVYERLKKRNPNLEFLLFSDHGFIKIDKSFDLKEYFKRHSRKLSDYIHIIDNNFARFWFRNDKERADIVKIFNSIENGFILTEETLKEYHLNMPDNRYGDFIFYLDEPYAFRRPWNPLNLRDYPKPYLHGYLPEKLPGLLVSSRPLISNTQFELVDIMVSVISLFGIKIPDYVDGKVIWKS